MFFVYVAMKKSNSGELKIFLTLRYNTRGSFQRIVCEFTAFVILVYDAVLFAKNAPFTGKRFGHLAIFAKNLDGIPFFHFQINRLPSNAECSL